MSALNGWHRGELLIHQKMGHAGDYNIMTKYQNVGGELPSEHAVFHTTRLPFIPVTTLDDTGRPWGSILAGAEGKPGFVRQTDYSVLSVDAKLWPGEPLLENANGYKDPGSLLVAGIGVEFSTRRRNKFAGKVMKLERDGDIMHLDFFVDEALGNCPKYITTRELIPHPDTSPKVVHKDLRLKPGTRLPDDVISFITESDTVFLGTTYSARDVEATFNPSHLGMNVRGGKKGYIRVVPSDGRTIVIPDLSGNRYMTSLGNIEATPMASLTIVSFTTGDILYLTGYASNLYNQDAQRLMPFQDVLTTILVTGYVYVSDALPVRLKPDTTPVTSAYNPPVRYLAEERPQTQFLTQDDDGAPATALLKSLVLHSQTLATFTWETSAPLTILPGQAAIIDLRPLLGARQYQHMAPMDPASVNDDRIRTWTISSHRTLPVGSGSENDSSKATTEFSLTMREKPGGLVTTNLFRFVRKLGAARPEMLDDTRMLKMSVGIVGVTGDFVLPSVPVASGLLNATTTTAGIITNEELGVQVPLDVTLGGLNLGADAVAQQVPPALRLLWVAGGIGVTPFLAMLRGLKGTTSDIRLVLSTREPDVLLPLVASALEANRENRPANLVLDVFSEKDIPDFGVEGVTLRKHAGRFTKDVFVGPGGEDDAVLGREVFVCGPEKFETSVIDMLEDVGVERRKIRRENFAY